MMKTPQSNSKYESSFIGSRILSFGGFIEDRESKLNEGWWSKILGQDQKKVTQISQQIHDEYSRVPADYQGEFREWWKRQIEKNWISYSVPDKGGIKGYTSRILTEDPTGVYSKMKHKPSKDIDSLVKLLTFMSDQMPAKRAEFEAEAQKKEQTQKKQAQADQEEEQKKKQEAEKQKKVDDSEAVIRKKYAELENLSDKYDFELTLARDIKKFLLHYKNAGGKSGGYRDPVASATVLKSVNSEALSPLPVKLMKDFDHLCKGNLDQKFEVSDFNTLNSKISSLSQNLLDLLKDHPVWIKSMNQNVSDLTRKIKEMRMSKTCLNFLQEVQGKTYREVVLALFTRRGALIDNTGVITYHGSDRDNFHKDKFAGTIKYKKRKGYGLFTSPDLEVAYKYAQAQTVGGMTNASYQKGDKISVYRIVIGDLPFIAANDPDIEQDEIDVFVKFGFGGLDGWGEAEKLEHEITILNPAAIKSAELIGSTNYPDQFKKIEGWSEEYLQSIKSKTPDNWKKFHLAGYESADDRPQ